MPFDDLRTFIDRLDDEGQLHRIDREVDWNLELSHVAKLNEERQGGGSALLFNNVKDYPGHRVFTSALTARERLALALDMPEDTSLMNLSQEWVDRIHDNRVPPKEMDWGPTKENVLVGDDADITKIPSPWFYPGDGGRYFGTGGYLITRNLKTGRLNLGTYRAMVGDRQELCIFMIKAKDGEIDFRDYQEAGIPMPVAYVSGCDPTLFMCGSTLFGLEESE
jgi:4-hydroxy-3-polyprenylbenzoate decarboxylase